MSEKRKHELVARNNTVEEETEVFPKDDGKGLNYLVNIDDDGDSSDGEYEYGEEGDDEGDELLEWIEEDDPVNEDEEEDEVKGEKESKATNIGSKANAKETKARAKETKARAKETTANAKETKAKAKETKTNAKENINGEEESGSESEYDTDSEEEEDDDGVDSLYEDSDDEKEDNSKPEKEDNSKPKKGGNSKPKKKDNALSTKKDNALSTKKDNALSTKKDNVLSTKKDNALSKKKERTFDADSGIDIGLSKETTEGENSLSKALDSVEGKVYDEYEYDSSDEEDLRNTIGNIPINWYDDYDHIGYDLDGKHIIKPEQGDTLDKFLNKLENPDFNRTVFDKQTGQEVRLSDEDLDIVKRIMGHRVPDAKFEMYPKFLDLYSHEVMEMPLSGRPEHKRSFIPSRNEAAYVSRRALLIRQNLIKYRTKKKEKRQEFNYNLWHDEGTKIRGVYNHMQAPRRKLPGHGESYHPPPEYLPTDPGARKQRMYSSLRQVPAYRLYIREQWDRCLNLYLAPRRRIMRIQASSTDLIPLLPKPQDLRPFPTQEALVFYGHKSIIRTISVHPLGKFLASGSDDRTVKIWEISTGRCLRSFDIEGAVKHVSWNPSTKLFLLAVCYDKNVVFLNPETYLVDKMVVNQTNQIFRYEPDQGDYIRPDRVISAVKWRTASADEWAKGYRIIVEHFRAVKQIVWHKQGDYFSTVIPEGDNRSVLMHQLSRWRSQVPFNKCKGRVQTVAFHPKLPFLYVVTQSHIRVYNLLKQQMTKKIQSNCRWISSIAVHPGGEHFLIGGYDRKLNWFEMECTRRPHALRYHKAAIRSVAYHRKYPLFASSADEGRVIVSHGMVYNDWIKDPLLVPLKELKGHRFFDGLYVLDLAWHPFEPYLFTAGADATIRLWH